MYILYIGKICRHIHTNMVKSIQISIDNCYACISVPNHLTGKMCSHREQHKANICVTPTAHQRGRGKQTWEWDAVAPVWYQYSGAQDYCIVQPTLINRTQIEEWINQLWCERHSRRAYKIDGPRHYMLRRYLVGWIHCLFDLHIDIPVVTLLLWSGSIYFHLGYLSWEGDLL